MKTRAGNFLLILTGIILACLTAEIFVRVFLPQDKMVTWLEMHPRGFMMNQSGIDAVHHFNDRELHYSLNKYGLRGEEEINENNMNILLLGDSFTFGLLLPQEKTYAAQLQHSLQKRFPSQNINVLNGGVGGAGLADWPAWLEHKGESLSPDIILLYLNNNDVDRALSKNLYVADQDNQVLLDSRRWKMRGLFRSMGRSDLYRWLQEHSEMMNILVKIAWRYLYFSDQTPKFDPEKSQVPVPPPEGFDPESGYSLQLARLLTGRLQNWCGENNCTFILTTTGFFDEDSAGAHTYLYYEHLTEQPPSGTYFFDNTPCVKKKTDGQFNRILIPGDTHPDETGATIIADCSLVWLQPFLEKEIYSP